MSQGHYRNYFVHDQEKIDIKKVREEAIHRRDKEDQSCVIHFHQHGQGCKGRQHEYYATKEDEANIVHHH